MLGGSPFGGWAAAGITQSATANKGQSEVRIPRECASVINKAITKSQNTPPYRQIVPPQSPNFFCRLRLPRAGAGGLLPYYICGE
jgi:hypothetical protein